MREEYVFPAIFVLPHNMEAETMPAGLIIDSNTRK
jgi:hypothetical protein